MKWEQYNLEEMDVELFVNFLIYNSIYADGDSRSWDPKYLEEIESRAKELGLAGEEVKSG